MSKDRPLPLPSNCIVSGYRIVRRLAEGGFGMVYLVSDGQGHLFALKEYLPAALVFRHVGQLAPTIRPGKEALYRLGMRSFFEEGRSLAQISHPSVVKVLNFFQENSTVYMLMELLSGHTLQDFITLARKRNKGKILREATILTLFDDLLSGLRYVHQQKVLHLDIKPANVFVSTDDKPVLIDFGAAREVLNKEGLFVRPMYTPGFAAPEMYDKVSNFGPWTDIYAVGACLYSCMTGYPPQDVPKRKEFDKLPEALARLRTDYSPLLIRLVAWCLNMDALARPQSVHAVQKQLFLDVP
jgi:eukaryotic-like serine/threonine-protein kinase